MNDGLTPRRRSLRPRKVLIDVEQGASSNRRLRSSRARVSVSDFLVFDNENDLDWDKNKAADHDLIDTKSSNKLSRERRSSRRTTSSRDWGDVRDGRNIRERRSARNRSLVGERKAARESTASLERTTRRNLKPTKQKPQISSRAARASRRTNQKFGIVDDGDEEDDDEDLEIEAFDEIEPESSSDSVLSCELESDFSEIDESAISFRSRRNPRSQRKKQAQKPKKYLPEDVPGRQATEDQPEPDPEDIKWSPSVAFIAIFIATFIDLFSDLPYLPSPQDIEEGLMSDEPSELVELLFRRLLGLVLNRKKELEVGKYGSALSELHSLRGVLGQSLTFPPLNWKSRNNAFAELAWYDRVELLHVLIHWSLVNSDRVKALLRTLPEESTMPWMGADDKGNHYYIVGFDPLAEGSQEYTRFRIYRETNRLLTTIKWEPVASNVNEVLQFLKGHEIKSEIPPAKDETSEETPITGDTAHIANGVANEIKELSDNDQKPFGNNQEVGKDGDAIPAPTTEPVKYNLPDTVVEILQNLIPTMQLSEEITSERLRREAKKARRKQDILYHAEAIARGEGRYAGRVRRRRMDYAEMIRNSFGRESSDDEDDKSRKRKRRLRTRDSDYEWAEPEPETRQQRHARLMADRLERDNYSRDVSVTPQVKIVESPVPQEIKSNEELRKLVEPANHIDPIEPTKAQPIKDVPTNFQPSDVQRVNVQLLDTQPSNVQLHDEHASKMSRPIDQQFQDSNPCITLPHSGLISEKSNAASTEVKSHLLRDSNLEHVHTKNPVEIKNLQDSASASAATPESFLDTETIAYSSNVTPLVQPENSKPF